MKIKFKSILVITIIFSIIIFTGYYTYKEISFSQLKGSILIDTASRKDDYILPSYDNRGLNIILDLDKKDKVISRQLYMDITYVNGKNYLIAVTYNDKDECYKIVKVIYKNKEFTEIETLYKAAKNEKITRPNIIDDKLIFISSYKNKIAKITLFDLKAKEKDIIIEGQELYGIVDDNIIYTRSKKTEVYHDMYIYNLKTKESQVFMKGIVHVGNSLNGKYICYFKYGVTNKLYMYDVLKKINIKILEKKDSIYQAIPSNDGKYVFVELGTGPRNIRIYNTKNNMYKNILKEYEGSLVPGVVSWKE